MAILMHLHTAKSQWESTFASIHSLPFSVDGRVVDKHGHDAHAMHMV